VEPAEVADGEFALLVALEHLPPEAFFIGVALFGFGHGLILL
jgi:hypothetical protein